MQKAHIFHVLAATLVLVTGGIGVSAAQNPPNADQDQSIETLKVNVDVVQLFFNVKDKHGALIPNLTKDDFEIYEDGSKQNLTYFTAETNLPLTLGILKIGRASCGKECRSRWSPYH